MRIGMMAIAVCVALTATGCGNGSQNGSAGSADSGAADAAARRAAAPRNEGAGLSAGDVEFPVIPMIRVPSLVGSSEAQEALESSMKSLIDPIAGVTVRPANCATDGALVNESGYTNLDAAGNLERVGGEGVFNIAADGSGSAVGGHGVVEVNKDGSGSVVNGAGVFEVTADGAGSYVGEHGTIVLDGKGGGSWTGGFGVITNNGDGSGSWVGEEGTIEIRADGSGSWVGGPHGLVENRGDGTGTVGAPAREVKMAPIPPVAKAGRFPLLNKFQPPGAPCGFVITLNDAVLFDFDKSDIRPDAAKVLDTLGKALAEVTSTGMEIRGHTDAKGADEYNQALSERRAQSVIAALRERGAAGAASAKGYGESQPVAPNEVDGKDNPAGRQLNRRVEIFVRT